MTKTPKQAFLQERVLPTNSKFSPNLTISHTGFKLARITVSILYNVKGTKKWPV